MKPGDIVCFNSTYIHIDHDFKPGVKYRIDQYNGKSNTGIITNLEDDTIHYVNANHWSRMVTLDQWRDMQINKILNIRT